MIKYKSIGSHELTNRGTVFFVKSEKERSTKDNDLIGSQVMIDGKIYIVKSVESFAISIIRKGQQIGLLI